MVLDEVMLSYTGGRGGLLALSLSFFFSFIFISWRLIILQYCSGFCHTFTCIPHLNAPPPPAPPDSSGSSQCTRPEHL